MNKKIQKKLLLVLTAVGLLSATCFWGCRLNTTSIAALTGSYNPPKLLFLDALGTTEIQAEFSEKITVELLSIFAMTILEGENDEADRPESLQFGEQMECTYSLLDAKQLNITLASQTEIGKKYGLEGRVRDAYGNTLSFTAMFSGFNDRVPRLILSEVRTEYSKPKVEFIELYSLSAGNLGGVSLYSVKDGEELRYEFPAVEISAGEYIVVHLRTVEEGCHDELASLDVSLGTEALPTARDFWSPNSKARIGKTDVIFLEKRKNGQLMDALLLRESKQLAWPNAQFEAGATRAVEAGIWIEGAAIQYAVLSDAVTVSRTLSRQGNYENLPATEPLSVKASDWLVVHTSNATPGKKNSSVPYVAK